jgi:hypothetical protein
VEARTLDVVRALVLAKAGASRLDFLSVDYLWERFSAEALADETKFEPFASLLEQQRLGRTARGAMISRLTTALTSPEPLPDKQLNRYAVALFHLLALQEAKPFHDNIVGTYLPTVLDVAETNARPASHVFANHPAERTRALQILGSYQGNESPAVLLAWLRR